MYLSKSYICTLSQSLSPHGNCWAYINLGHCSAVTMKISTPGLGQYNPFWEGLLSNRFYSIRIINRRTTLGCRGCSPTQGLLNRIISWPLECKGQTRTNGSIIAIVHGSVSHNILYWDLYFIVVTDPTKAPICYAITRSPSRIKITLTILVTEGSVDWKSNQNSIDFVEGCRLAREYIAQVIRRTGLYKCCMFSNCCVLNT